MRCRKMFVVAIINNELSVDGNSVSLTDATSAGLQFHLNPETQCSVFDTR